MIEMFTVEISDMHHNSNDYDSANAITFTGVPKDELDYLITLASSNGLYIHIYRANA